MKQLIRDSIKTFSLTILGLALVVLIGKAVGINIFAWAAPAAINNLGTEFQICTNSLVLDDFIFGHLHPRPVFSWDFTSSQSDYTDGEPPPAYIEATLSPSSQVSIWIEIDDNSDFSSPIVSTAEIITSSSSYAYTGLALSYSQIYYWRMKVKDSYDSISAWVVGGAFIFNDPYEENINSIRLRGGVNLRSGIILK